MAGIRENLASIVTPEFDRRRSLTVGPNLKTDIVLGQNVVRAAKIDIDHRLAAVRNAARDNGVKFHLIGTAGFTLALGQHRIMMKSVADRGHLTSPGIDVIANLNNNHVRRAFAQIWKAANVLVSKGWCARYGAVVDLYSFVVAYVLHSEDKAPSPLAVGEFAADELAAAFIECWRRYHLLASRLSVPRFRHVWMRSFPPEVMVAAVQAAELDLTPSSPRPRQRIAELA